MSTGDYVFAEGNTVKIRCRSPALAKSAASILNSIITNPNLRLEDALALLNMMSKDELEFWQQLDKRGRAGVQ